MNTKLTFYTYLIRFGFYFQTLKNKKNRDKIELFPFDLKVLFPEFQTNSSFGKIVFFILLFFTISFVNAATKTSTGTGGLWTTTTTWVGGIIPATGDDVFIAAGATVTNVPLITIKSLTINSTATLNIGITNALTITTTFVNNGTYTGTTGIINVTGDFTNNGTISLSTGKINVISGNFDNLNPATLNFSGTGILALGGNYTNTGTVTLVSSSVQFTGGTNQAIQGYTTTGTTSMLKTGGSATFSGNVNGGALTINGTGGTLNLGASGRTHTFTGTITRTAGTLDCGPNYLKINGNVSGTTAAFTAVNATVEYAGGTQTAVGTIYNNLIVSGSGIKTFPTNPTVNTELTLKGAAYVAITSGVLTYGTAAKLRYDKPKSYTTTAEWVSPFTASGGVIIDNVGRITLGSSKVFNNAIPLTVNSGSLLYLGTQLLTLNGDLINNAGNTGVTGLTGGVTISGTVSQNIGAFTTTGTVTVAKTAGTATFTADVKGAALTVNGIGGTLNLGVDRTHNFTGTVTLTSGTLNGGSSRLNVTVTSTTAWNGTGSNFIAGTGTVNFGGLAQTLATPTTFNNLIFSNSGAKNLTGTPTINGTLSMEGKATVDGVAPAYGSTAKLQYNRTSARLATLEWVTPFTATGGVSIINKGIINCNTDKVFGASAPLNIANDVGGGLSSSGYAISGVASLTLADGASLYLGGASTFPTGFATNTLGIISTVEYNGTNQTVAVQNYGNLALRGSKTKTFAGAITIANVLAMSSTSVAILSNGSTSETEQLSLDGISQIANLYGGTGSTATTKNGTKFGTTTTGILNVKSSCNSGSWLGEISADWNDINNWCAITKPTSKSDVVIGVAKNQPIIGLTGGICKTITIDAGSTLTISPLSTLTVSGNWINEGTLTSSGTTTFNGTGAQSISGLGTNVFKNLTNSNITSAVTTTSDITINGILNNSIGAVLDLGDAVLTGGPSFSNFGLGQIKTENTSATPIPSGKIWPNPVVYNNVNGDQKVVAGTYSSLTLDNTTGTQTATGTITINNTLNMPTGSPYFKMNGFGLTVNDFNIIPSGAVLDMEGGALSFTSSTKMEGTVRFSGASNGKAILAGTVDYYGSGQTVAGGTYNDLTFTGIGGSYSVNNEVVINGEILISSGAVTVQNGVSVSVDNNITVNTTGSFIFENNASLIQLDVAAINTGVINYKRNTAPVKRYDFTYWSSPVQGQTLKNLSPNTLADKYYSYNDNNWVISNNGLATMQPGNGYAIRAPQSFSSTTAAIDTAPVFIGKPNNGKITLSLAADKFYLLGNPYPSALDADTFLNDNTAALEGTLYFWTHNSPPSSAIAGTGVYNYSSNDYASYNKTGGVGGVKSTTETRGDSFKPSGKIASGQGFFVQASALGGSLVFNNGMRVAGGALGINNNQFFRTKSISKTKDLFEKNRLWLNLYNNQGAFKQTLLGYLTGASNEYDNGYDGESFDGNDYVDFYSINQNKNLVIQGRELPFDETDTVPLGYRSTIVGTFIIEIDQTDGSLESQNIYIEDKLMNVVHNLKTTSYSFTTEAGRFDNRFILRYTDRTLGTTDFETLESQVLILKVKGKLNIKSVKETIKQITVFDLQGQKVFEKQNVNSNDFFTSTIDLNQQIGIVKVTLMNGQVISKKVIF